MKTQNCLRCNLPLNSDRGCICTSPNWRIYNPNETEYLKPSTVEQPLLWLTLFMGRGEIFRFRGDFFAYALNNPSEIIKINEFEHYFDAKWDVSGAPEPFNRNHYANFLYNKVIGEVKKSINLMKDALNASDKIAGKHFLYRYIRSCDDILHNLRKVQKPSHVYDALESAFDPLNTFLESEKEYYFSDTPENNINLSEEESDDNLNKELKIISIQKNEFWEQIPMKVVIKHFVKLSLNKNKKGESYLTNVQFISFLKRGFLNDQKQAKQSINCHYGEKVFVIGLFYDFFDIATSKYWHPIRKEPFINLILNSFDNWKRNTIESSFRPNKTKRKW